MSSSNKSIEFLNNELSKENLEFSQNKSGRKGVDFILKTNTGSLHNVYLQPINLNKERSVNLPAGRQES